MMAELHREKDFEALGEKDFYGGRPTIYFYFLARLTGALYVSVESGTSALVIDDGARGSCGSGGDGGSDSTGWFATTAAPGTPCLVLAPAVLELVADRGRREVVNLS